MSDAVVLGLGLGGPAMHAALRRGGPPRRPYGALAVVGAVAVLALALLATKSTIEPNRYEAQ